MKNPCFLKNINMFKSFLVLIVVFVLIFLNFIQPFVFRDFKNKNAAQSALNFNTQQQIVVVLQVGNKVALINGVPRIMEAAPFIENSRTLVPVRLISEAFGAEVLWDSQAQTVSIKFKSIDQEISILLKIGDTKAYVDKKLVILDVAPKIVEGRTFVPIRFVAETFKADVLWEKETQKITITYTKPSGILNIKSKPDKAKVFINSEYKGETPLLIELKPGKYMLMLKKEGHEDYSVTIEILKGKTLTLDIELKALQRTGILSLQSEPQGAKVYINQILKGLTPLKIELYEGEYELKIELSGYITYTSKVVIKANSTLDLMIILERAKGTLFIKTEPQGASVFLNDKNFGKTPLTIEVETGVYTLKIELSGYKTYTEEIEIKEDQIKTVNITLQKVVKPGTIIWQSVADNLITDPVIYNKKIFSFSEDGYLYAISDDKGLTLWKLYTAYTDTKPELYNAKLFISNYQDKVFMVSPEDGKVEWEISLTLEPQLPSEPFKRNEIYLKDDKLYIAARDGYINIYDILSRKRLARTFIKHSGVSSYLSKPIIKGDILFVSWKDETNGAIFGLDLKNGVSKFITTIGTNDFSYVIKDDFFYIWTLNYIQGFKTKTGEFMFSKCLSPCSGVPGIGKLYEYQGILFGSADSGRFFAFDPLSRELLWQNNINGVGIPVFYKGSVYIVSSDETLYSFELSRGVVNFRSVIPDGKGVPLAFNDKIYVPSIKGILYSLDLKGQEVFKTSFFYTLLLNPIESSGGLYIIACKDINRGGYVYKIEP